LDIGIVVNLLLVALLILLTAFFVGSEFAVIKVRMSRIEQLIAEGNKKAIAAKKVVTNLDYYLSACQLGITVTALGLGALGEPTVEKILHPLFHDFGVPDAVSASISMALALLLMTYLHVVLGEMAPKTLAIQFAEKMTMLMAPPLVLFGKIAFPFIWLLNGSARVLLRAFGVNPAGHEQAHSEEELKIIMTQSYQSGEINQTELAYMQNIFTFDERVVRDIMVPRLQAVIIDQSMTQEEVLRIVDEHGYTRYPVTENGDKDKIIGFLNAKEFMTNVAMKRPVTLKKQIHAIDVVLETVPVQDVLLKMQKKSVHIAVVIDEYGGTAGIVTMEDILEEIVGEIRDEFDQDEVPDILQVNNREYVINGRVLLSDLEERLGLSFDDGYDVETVGGWLQVQIKDFDQMPETISYGDQTWKIVEMDNYQILKASLVLSETQPDPEPTE